MSQFGFANSSGGQQTTLHSDFGSNMLVDQQYKQEKQPLLSFKYHPGFFCFFEDYTNRQGWTFHQCYQKVFQSHHQMNKIKRLTQQIARDQNLDKVDKIKQLMNRAQKDKVYAYYLKGQDGQLQCNVVLNQDKRIQDTTKLKNQLQKLQNIKDKIISQKKKQFQQKQILKSKQQQQQIEGILNQKERRANLIRKVQLQAVQRKILRQKQGKQNFLQSTINNCEIM